MERDTLREFMGGYVQGRHFECRRRKVGPMYVRLGEALREQDGEAT